MRKEKIKVDETVENQNIDFTSHTLGTDREILEQIDKRNDENQALKKLLENLNTTLTKQEIKSSKS